MKEKTLYAFIAIILMLITIMVSTVFIYIGEVVVGVLMLIFGFSIIIGTMVQAKTTINKHNKEHGVQSFNGSDFEEPEPPGYREYP